MIEVTDSNGRKHFLALAAIASVYEAGASSQWHGIKSYVKTFDGETIESRDDAQSIAIQCWRVQAGEHGGGDGAI